MSLSKGKYHCIFVSQSTINNLNVVQMRDTKKYKLAKVAAMYSVFRAFVLLCSLLTFNTIFAQGWEMRFGGDKEDFGQSVLQVDDRGYIIAGYSESFGDDNDLDIYIVRTDVDGTLLWSQSYDEGLKEYGYDIIRTEDNGFLVVGQIFETESGKPKACLLKISEQGQRQWFKTYGEVGVHTTAESITKVVDGYILVGTSDAEEIDNRDAVLIKVDFNGEVVWQKSFGGETAESGKAVVALADNTLIFAANKKEQNGLNNNIILTRVDQTGSVYWTKEIGDVGDNELVNELMLTQNNEIVFVGSANNYNKNLIGRYDSNGNEVWRRIFGNGDANELADLVELEDGHLVAVGYTEQGGFNVDVSLVKFDADGNMVWDKRVGDVDGVLDTAEGIATTQTGGFIIAGYSGKLFPFFNDLSLTLTDSEGEVLTNQIKGRVFYSTDGCNDYETGDMLMPDWIVKATGANNTYFGTTNENGEYAINVDSGFYSVELLPLNAYWELCAPTGFSANFENYYDTTSINFSVIEQEACPLLQVDVSTDILINCDDANYMVNYGNTGPVLAEDAYVEITLDEELTFNSSTLPFSNQDGNTFTFELGNVNPFEFGGFEINVDVACTGIAEGQVAMVDAHIYPDSICTPTGAEWDGSSIYVRGECIDNYINFYIGNEPDASPMVNARQAFIVEDQILFLQEPFTLDPGEEIPLPTIQGNGSTFRLIAEQADGHPGNSNPTIALEGCVADGENYSTGQIAQFPENDQDAYRSIDIHEIIESQLPIVLRSYPKGYSDEAIITPTTDLEYTLVFSNLGTDTISRVVIRDTLPTSLDLNSLELGASSHPYDFEIYNNGILKITFDEIQLQPLGSSANKGFVHFKISQKTDTPLETVIQNRAAIFFDYNEPVSSNTVEHLVGCMDLFDDGCIVASFDLPNTVDFSVKVYPNPFEESTLIELVDNQFDSVTFSLYNAQGQLVQQGQFEGNTYTFYRNQLLAGTYFIRLHSDETFIGSGKLLIK